MILLLLLVPLLIFLDYRAGPGFSLRLFYLIPTALAAWVLGRGAGVVVAIGSAAFCLFVDASIRSHGARATEILWEGASNLALFVILAIVIARHRRFMDEALELTPIDPATGLLTRREFERLFEVEKRRSRRYRRPLALVLVECAGAKGQAGTALLAAVGRLVQVNIREGDFVGPAGDRRLGLILLEGTPEVAKHVLERVREKLLEGMGEKLRSTGLGLSLVSYGGQSDRSAAELLALAAERMHLAQGEGGVSVAETTVP